VSEAPLATYLKEWAGQWEDGACAVAGHFPNLPPTPAPRGLGAHVPDRKYHNDPHRGVTRLAAHRTQDEWLLAWEKRQAGQ
jgi:hypothetical protein